MSFFKCGTGDSKQFRGEPWLGTAYTESSGCFSTEKLESFTAYISHIAEIDSGTASFLPVLPGGQTEEFTVYHSL